MVLITEAQQTGGYSVLCLCALWYPQSVYQQEEVCGLQSYGSEHDPTLWSIGVEWQRKDGRRPFRPTRPTAALPLITKQPSLCLISAGTSLLRVRLKREIYYGGNVSFFMLKIH
jgi:hypothetical protein